MTLQACLQLKTHRTTSHGRGTKGMEEGGHTC